MYKNKKILAIIPARQGSKAIINKNLYPLNGKPLIEYTIDIAKSCKYLDKIVCSTNGKEIADFCKSKGIHVIRRPEEMSNDTAPTIEAVNHCVETLKINGETYDYLLLLQPTSPDRKIAYVNGIIEETIDHNYVGMLSVHKIEISPLLMRYKKDNKLENISSASSTCRRQDMKQAYYVNGMLYTYEVRKLTASTSLNDIPYGFETPLEDSLDINTLSDIKIWNTKHN